jgi:hypothetical protein
MNNEMNENYVNARRVCVSTERVEWEGESVCVSAYGKFASSQSTMTLMFEVSRPPRVLEP